MHFTTILQNVNIHFTTILQNPASIHFSYKFPYSKKTSGGSFLRSLIPKGFLLIVQSKKVQ
ncbi:hypothetical protein A3J19_05280 [Candidatus Daviesbacteria bacterium RIFCSPLOWO2_02_FULL_41_8]|uniref:Uncharacterized protein n=2 Tax=Candidatus Daviesiibacteriota TaxID=1752718 RepID=A0A1F5NIW9_9BACT|nr:MAG: hypothetical protein A2871_02255 [Candidatus Daviesbacteria bacterium RIFCSPHIGHO2_01_FULL_41_23]OGE77646.1 MAG: hypothetical protein A3J19_05280 [Candidatus Daviesbacteria bacterium RIFCSPLOWO2_02_FULL_41_8]